MSRLLWFVLGVVVTLAVIIVGGYAFVRSGGVNMRTSAGALPFEQRVAMMAVHASFESDSNLKDPLPLTTENLASGAQVYVKTCSGCHGLPGDPAPIARDMFPAPPQLFEPDDMVTDDPEGETYAKVSYGIRLSGMPSFEKMLSNPQRWQVAQLLAHADKLPPAVKAALHR